MSLQPGINPLEEIAKMKGNWCDGTASFPSCLKKWRYARRLTWEVLIQVILMAAPKLRQDATMNQANMVSSPYFEANEKAAEKTNPMNAASQEPGRSFLMKYIGK